MDNRFYCSILSAEYAMSEELANYEAASEGFDRDEILELNKKKRENTDI